MRGALNMQGGATARNAGAQKLEKAQTLQGTQPTDTLILARETNFSLLAPRAVREQTFILSSRGPS